MDQNNIKDKSEKIEEKTILNPELVFELVKQGDTCLLRRLDTMKTWSLKTKLCFKR